MTPGRLQMTPGRLRDPLYTGRPAALLVKRKSSKYWDTAMKKANIHNHLQIRPD